MTHLCAHTRLHHALGLPALLVSCRGEVLQASRGPLPLWPWSSAGCVRLGASLAAASLTAKGALLKYRPFSVGTGGALIVGAAGCAARCDACQASHIYINTLRLQCK